MINSSVNSNSIDALVVVFLEFHRTLCGTNGLLWMDLCGTPSPALQEREPPFGYTTRYIYPALDP